MRLTFAALLLLSSTAAFAETTIAPPSRVEEVEVFASGARVTRVVVVEVPREGTTLVLPNLPEAVEPGSVRVTGEGALLVGAVDQRVVPPDQRPVAAPEIERRIQALRDEIAEIDLKVAAAESRRRLAAGILADPRAYLLGQGEASRPVTTEQIRALLDFLIAEQSAAGGEALTLARSKRAAEAEIATLERERAGDPTRRRPRTEVRITLTPQGEAAQSGRVAVSYRVPQARWRPHYDARLTMEGAAPRLEIVRRAEVTQSTGEDWAEARVVLSTARTSGRVAAPLLPGLRLGFQPPAVAATPPAMLDNLTRERAVSPQRAPMPAGPLAAAPPPAPIGQMEATVEVSGLEAQFVVPARVTVPGTGVATNVRIGTTTTAPAVLVRASPLVDTQAYLHATFTSPDEAPILPGRVSLFRDAVFVGVGSMPQLAKGETADIGFGVDPRSRIERAPEVRNATTSGIFGGNAVETREARITIRNLHGRPMRYAILDRIPFAETSEITIEPAAGTTAPTERDVDGRRGVHRWIAEVPPGAEHAIRLGWRITAPRDRPLSEFMDRAAGS